MRESRKRVQVNHAKGVKKLWWHRVTVLNQKTFNLCQVRPPRVQTTQQFSPLLEYPRHQSITHNSSHRCWSAPDTNQISQMARGSKRRSWPLMRQIEALMPLTEPNNLLPFPDEEVRDGRINLRGLGYSDQILGWTLMHAAVWNRRLDLAEWLYKHGAKSLVNKPNIDGDTPLMRAVEKGHMEIAEWLLSHGGAATDTNNRGETPLQIACRYNHLDIAQLLVGSAQADIHSRCNYKRTPLLEAVMQSTEGHSDCMHWLLANGAAQDAAVPWSEGSTPLMFACQHEDLDVVKLMFAGTGSDAAHLMVADPDSGTTPIISACRRGHLELVIWLVENGVCNLESTNSAGNTPIMFALTAKRFDILKFLVGAISQAGGSVRVLQAVNHKNPGSATPLNLALETKQFDVAEWLIEAGADLFEVGAEQSAKWTVDNTEKAPQQICAPVCGRNIMHRMAGTGNLKAVEWLVASGARGQVATADSQGCTPMLLACQHCDLDMPELLRNCCTTTVQNGVSRPQIRVVQHRFSWLVGWDICISRNGCRRKEPKNHGHMKP